MLQRLSKSAHRVQVDGAESSRNSSRNGTTNHYENGVLAPQSPVVAKVDHHSIELSWEQPSDGASLKGDKRLKYELQEEDRRTHEYSTVYIGYGENYKIEGLDPLHAYNYRLKVSTSDGDVSFSPNLHVYTTNEPYTSDQLHRATIKGDIEMVTKIMESREVNVDVHDKFGFTPLMNACQKGYLNIVEYLIESRADVNATNSSGKNSLMMACYSGHGPVVQRLREAGANWNSEDRGGSSPLHWAIDGQNCALIQWILDDGAKVDLRAASSGWTPLIRCAAITGNAEVAAVLLSAGANFNAVDHDGKTALMIASLNGHLKLVELLLESGADTKIRSGHGKTALEMAMSFDRRPIVKLFEEMQKSHTDVTTTK
ncbi:fibronectin type 3 and ankyrin repeat domains 1 protein isoform X1 [Ciona intestinalis]